MIRQTDQRVWIMAKTVLASFSPVQSTSAPVLADDVDNAIEETLAALADVDKAYEERRTMLARRSLSLGQKKRLGAEVDKLYQQDRQPLVLRLAELHYRKTRLTLFKMLH
jgi:hypothetical protein